MRVAVVVPTYQEAENVDRFIRSVRSAVPSASILIADDDSPDGTGAIAEAAAAEVGQVSVLHRKAKEGLGAAYREAFAKVLDEGADVVVQMDCDFSHDPAMIGPLVDALAEGVDCSIGSRYVPGGATPNWPLHRRLLSRYGNLYTSAVLGLGVADATSGFRAYRASALRAIDVGSTRSNGYAFMSEIAHRMVRRGMRIEEIPITFVDRVFGSSKMSVRIIVESMLRVTVAGLRARLGRNPADP